MKSLATAFKEVYGEALKEYGFKKVKSKYPYYARMVGDEIVQVITYRTETCPTRNKKAFNILGGVATVYRGEINLDDNPSFYVGWLKGNHNLSEFLYGFDLEEKNSLKITQFEYDKQDEEDLLNAMRYSMEVTKENLIEAFNRICDLGGCLEYFRICNSTTIWLYKDMILDEKCPGHNENDWPINILVYGDEKIEDFNEGKRKDNEKWNMRFRHWMKVGKCGFSEEDFQKDQKERENGVLEQINIYKKLVTDAKCIGKVKDEIEKRKTRNTEILKGYGIM